MPLDLYVISLVIISLYVHCQLRYNIVATAVTNLIIPVTIASRQFWFELMLLSIAHPLQWNYIYIVLIKYIDLCHAGYSQRNRMHILHTKNGSVYTVSEYTRFLL